LGRHDGLRRFHDPEQLLGGRPDGEHRGLSGEVVRRDTLGVAELAWYHAQVAVLDAGIEANAVAPAAECAVERLDDLAALLARRMTGGEVDHGRWVGVVELHQVAPVRDVVGPELDAHRGRFDGRPSCMEQGRVVAEDRHVADVASGRQALRDDRRPSDLAARGQPRQRGHRRDLERGAVVELGDGLVGAAVRHEHDVLHALDGRRSPFGSPSRYRRRHDALPPAVSHVARRARRICHRRRAARRGVQR
jgi:hypothetical protein